MGTKVAVGYRVFSIENQAGWVSCSWGRLSPLEFNL